MHTRRQHKDTARTTPPTNTVTKSPIRFPGLSPPPPPFLSPLLSAMAASATFPATEWKGSPHRTASCPDQVDGAAADLDSVLFSGESRYGNINRSISTATAIRRRKPPDSGRRPMRQRSFSQDIGHAASETYLITRLSFKLLRFLGVGYQWITRLLALACYAMLLLPGFLQVGYYYYFSNQVLRSIVYGDLPRNRLDLYLPADCDGKKPVVVFVTGGAWIIGYKAWGALLGRHLAERDVIVASIDYRNFPQGTISDMVKDVSEGISFVCNHIPVYGGDPNRIYLMGQSAGAHISACALVKHAIKEAAGESISWRVSQIKGYFGLSGGYNLFKLVDHFHKRGLYRSIFLSIMDGEQSLGQFSPEIIIQNKTATKALPLLPPIILFHGTDDSSIPPDASKDFSDALNSKGAHAELVLYDGKTHTDLFLQDPLRGGKDPLFDTVLGVIHSGDGEALARDAMAPPRRRLVPELLLQLAHKVSPF